MITESRQDPILVSERLVTEKDFEPYAQATSDEVLAKTASDLYRVGSMLLGGEEETIALIEQVVASLDVELCSDLTVARHQGRLALGAGAIQILEQRHPGTLSAPKSEQSGPVSCIEDDDLDAAGVTHADLDRMMNGGSENQHLRSWLESLDLPLRVIFVLRAIAGLSTDEVATLLADHRAKDAPTDQDNRQSWSAEAVRSCFRQALCSLASQLLHASVAK